MSLSTDLALAPVLEVFASIQGEGLHVGRPQVFLRLRGCPLRCAWCDTPGSWNLQADDRARVASSEGPHRRPAWATPFQVACWVSEVEPGEPRPVSVTGGEPLLWPAFLLELPSMLGSRPLHLETAGGHPRTLEFGVDVFHHVSLDLKLPADLESPVELPEELPADPASQPEVGSTTDERAPRDEAEWQTARRA
jgi:organic radical activating enzyme